MIHMRRMTVNSFIIVKQQLFLQLIIMKLLPISFRIVSNIMK